MPDKAEGKYVYIVFFRIIVYKLTEGLNIFFVSEYGGFVNTIVVYMVCLIICAFFLLNLYLQKNI